MPSIEVDPDVMALLARHATPFVDTPNSVLRRLLGLDGVAEPVASATPRGRGASTISSPVSAVVSANSTVVRGDRREFIDRILAAEFGDRFKVHPPYQMMFESAAQLVYFQNFNDADTHNLWYRLSEAPLKRLRQSPKAAFVCFTNPAAGYAFLLPLQDILEQVRRAGWQRPNLEVNIDPASNVWREFGWDLSKYRRVY